MYGREYYYGGLGIEYSLPVSDLSFPLASVASETKPVQSSLVPYTIFCTASDGQKAGWGLRKVQRGLHALFSYLAASLFTTPYLLCSKMAILILFSNILTCIMR